jgi:hypothetical protein
MNTPVEAQRLRPGSKNCFSLTTITPLTTTTHMYNKENLAKVKQMDSLAPQVMKAFWAF